MKLHKIHLKTANLRILYIDVHQEDVRIINMYAPMTAPQNT